MRVVRRVVGGVHAVVHATGCRVGDAVKTDGGTPDVGARNTGAHSCGGDERAGVCGMDGSAALSEKPTARRANGATDSRCE